MKHRGNESQAAEYQRPFNESHDEDAARPRRGEHCHRVMNKCTSSHARINLRLALEHRPQRHCQRAEEQRDGKEGGAPAKRLGHGTACP
jgi:hypothetical protein